MLGRENDQHSHECKHGRSLPSHSQALCINPNDLLAYIRIQATYKVAACILVSLPLAQPLPQRKVADLPRVPVERCIEDDS